MAEAERTLPLTDASRGEAGGAPPPDDEPQVPERPPTPEDGDESEPGGAEPAAVRARKEYRARKRLEQDLQRERDARIAAESRATTLETAMRTAPTTAAPEPTTPKPEFEVFSDAQVKQAVEQGVLTELQAASYLAKREAYLSEQKIEQRRREADEQATRDTQQRDIEQRAGRELLAYTQLYPELTTGEHAQWPEIQAAYTELRQRGLPDTLTTQAIALRMVLGPVQTATQREEATRMARDRRASDFHTESGGGSSTRETGADPLAKVPQRYLEFWKRQGYTRDQMLAEAKYIPAERMK